MSGAIRTSRSGHVVICNCNEKVRRLVGELHAHDASLEIVLLVQDAALWQDNPAWHPDQKDAVEVLYGCPTEAAPLCSANIGEARAAVILADPRYGELADPRSTLVTIAIERQNPQVHTVMELLSSVSRVHVRTTEVNEVICIGDITEKLLAQSCITPGVGHIFQHLLSGDPCTEQLQVAKLPQAIPPNATFRSLARQAISCCAPFVLCGYIIDPDAHPDTKTRICVLNPRSGVEPGKNTRLAPGDALIVLGRQRPALEKYLLSNKR
jgi:hypothetical protein